MKSAALRVAVIALLICAPTPTAFASDPAFDALKLQVTTLQQQVTTQAAQIAAISKQITELKAENKAASVELGKANAQITLLKANDATLTSMLSQWFHALENWKGNHFLLSPSISGGKISAN